MQLYMARNDYQPGMRPELMLLDLSVSYLNICWNKGVKKLKIDKICSVHLLPLCACCDKLFMDGVTPCPLC